MPDKRKHRGAHPDDTYLFSPKSQPTIARGVKELSWLLSRGYSMDASLKLVGDRYHFSARQRMAVMRSSCSDQMLERRMFSRCASASVMRSKRLAVDGYNLLITIESALSGGLVLIGRDGVTRDLAGVHGTYRKVEETIPALTLIVRNVNQLECAGVDFYFDKPVSNSGKLKTLLAHVLEEKCIGWSIELHDNPDRVLVDIDAIVVSSDSAILDRCQCWIDLASSIIHEHISDAWVFDLSQSYLQRLNLTLDEFV